jgi:hypothetical protein
MRVGVQPQFPGIPSKIFLYGLNPLSYFTVGETHKVLRGFIFPCIVRNSYVFFSLPHHIFVILSSFYMGFLNLLLEAAAFFAFHQILAMTLSRAIQIAQESKCRD